jgi:hypothetical protein
VIGASVYRLLSGAVAVGVCDQRVLPESQQVADRTAADRAGEVDVGARDTFTPDETFPQTAPEQAAAILDRVGLAGAHNIVGNPKAPQMVIMRPNAAGAYRVTWRRPARLLIVERMQPFSAWRLLHTLHFRFGYQQPYFAYVTWAAMVDVVTISIWVWVLSGFYIWLRRPHTHLVGSLFAVGGSVLFIVLTILLCR